MRSARFAYGRLDAGGAGVLPASLEDIDYLILDGGPIEPPDQSGVVDVLLGAVERLAPRFYLDPNLRVIASLAGHEPRQVAEQVAARLRDIATPDLPISTVRGADLLGRLEELLELSELPDVLTKQSFKEQTGRTIAAVANLGTEPSLAALKKDARMVLVSFEDPCELIVACAAHAFDTSLLKNDIAKKAHHVGRLLQSLSFNAIRSCGSDSDIRSVFGLTAGFSEDGQAEFFGDARLREIAEEFSWDARDRVRDSMLQLMLEKRWLVSAMGWSGGIEDSDFAERIFNANGWEWDDPESTTVTHLPSEWEDSWLVALHAEFDQQATANEALLSAKQAFAALNAYSIDFRTLCPPALHPLLFHWTSKLPPIDLPWAVDTRPAGEWLYLDD